MIDRNPRAKRYIGLRTNGFVQRTAQQMIGDEDPERPRVRRTGRDRHGKTRAAVEDPSLAHGVDFARLDKRPDPKVAQIPDRAVRQRDLAPVICGPRKRAQGLALDKHDLGVGAGKRAREAQARRPCTDNGDAALSVSHVAAPRHAGLQDPAQPRRIAMDQNSRRIEAFADIWAPGRPVRQAAIVRRQGKNHAASAAVSAFMSASLCSGPGVKRSRSVPRGTVG